MGHHVAPLKMEFCQATKTSDFKLEDIKMFTRKGG